MWTYKAALRLIRAYVDIGSDGQNAVVESATLDLPYGWVFFYNSRAYLESGDSSR